MSTLTIRLPDPTASRLKQVAHSRGLSMNKLIEEMSTQAIAAFDAETRFRALAAQADRAAALAVLDGAGQGDRLDLFVVLRDTDIDNVPVRVYCINKQ